MTHKIHDALPSGFAYADAIQSEDYAASGSVNGASKVCLVRSGSGEPRLAVRLRPPFDIEDVTTDRPLIAREIDHTGKTGADALNWYRAEYDAGWRAGSRSGDMPGGSFSFDDGYLDRVAGRQKWHLTWCVDHDNCGEG